MLLHPLRRMSGRVPRTSSTRSLKCTARSDRRLWRHPSPGPRERRPGALRVRGGLTVRGGERNAIAIRYAVLGDGLAHLETELLEAFWRKIAEKQSARAGSARLQPAAMRDILDYIEAGLAKRAASRVHVRRCDEIDGPGTGCDRDRPLAGGKGLRQACAVMRRCWGPSGLGRDLMRSVSAGSSSVRGISPFIRRSGRCSARAV
jgi:hypothetical protein